MAREFTDDIQEKAFSQPAHRNVETCKKKHSTKGKMKTLKKWNYLLRTIESAMSKRYKIVINTKC